MPGWATRDSEQSARAAPLEVLGEEAAGILSNAREVFVLRLRGTGPNPDPGPDPYENELAGNVGFRLWRAANVAGKEEGRQVLRAGTSSPR